MMKSEDEDDVVFVPSDDDDKANETKDEEEDIVVESPLSLDEALEQQLSPVHNVANEESILPVVATFKDHFTLQIPTNTVRYRSSRAAARVLETADDQFVLEETYDEENGGQHQIEIRRIRNTSEGIRVLRISYALVTAFWTGFLFVFCLQVLLFLILDLAIETGATSKSEAHWGPALGVILALPSLVHGLASGLVIAGCYIQDTVNGHYLIRNFAFRHVSPVVVEWTFFAFFLGLPIFVMCCALLSRSDDWFAVTLLFWFSCILGFFVLFTVNVIWYELKACFEVIRNRYNDDNDNVFHVAMRCIQLRQVARYSALRKTRFLAYGAIVDSEDTDKGSTRNTNAIPATFEESISWRAKLTLDAKVLKWGLFEDLEGREERVYSIDDARDVRPYVTSYTWNLERVRLGVALVFCCLVAYTAFEQVFCRRRNSRYIAIIKGPGAVRKTQLVSSMICSVVGSSLVIFLVFSLLFYLGLGVIFSFFMTALAVSCFYPSFKSTYRLYQFGRDFKVVNNTLGPDDEEDKLDASKAVYLVEEYHRISKPTKMFCFVTFCLEVALFFVYPFLSLYSIGNYPLATLFIVVSGTSMVRNYFNAATVLEETGHMDLVDAKTPKKKWKAQSRLNEIVGNITRGRSRGAWTAVLGGICFVFLGLMLGAVGSETDSLATFDVPYTYSFDYEYVQQDSLRYPTCLLTNELDGPLQSMAGLAYRGRGNVTQRELDGWFGGTAVDRDALVTEWRGDLESAVSFKLVSFPRSGNFSYVLIRGTTNNWDMLTDAQLWSPAVFMQLLRELLPFGRMWNPVIDELIKLITKLESESINRVSFYRDTTAFVEYLKEQVPDTYAGLGITGHSLGGGLSIITGAQTGVPAVALSGPNALLSRKSFDPPITREDLDSNTFNIIPSRDIVPMIDDHSQNFQQIRCETELTDVVGCHDSTRSLCEIIFTCGSGNRPVLCECVTQFNYPEPQPKEGVTVGFKEFCATSERTRF